MSYKRPRLKKQINRKRDAKKQWIAFWIMLAITVSALIAIAMVVMQN
jgi:hypothetical protein